MKKIITVHLVLRIFPIILFFILILLELVSKAPAGRDMRVCCYLLASAVIYNAYPLTRDDAQSSLRFAAVCSIYYFCASLLLDEARTVEYLFLFPSAAFTVIHQAAFMIVKYREPATIFRKDAAWCCAEEDSRSFYALLTLVAAMVLMAFCQEGTEGYPLLLAIVFLLVLDMMLHARAYSGRTMLIGRRKERRIQTIVLTNGRYSDIVPEVDGTILTKAYRRIEQFMRDHKPYLDDRFTLEKMSESLKLNKVYISRAVNKFTGKNFRQYVNWHRVLYSVELMRADPWLKVIELAFMSGFHSQVTYNMCFKIFMDETPSDMLSRLRLQKPLPEPSKIEVKLPPDEVVPSSPDEET